MVQIEDLIKYHTKQLFLRMTGQEVDDSTNAVAFTGASISAVMDITAKNESKGFIGITMPSDLAGRVYKAMLGGDGDISPESESAVKEVLNIIAGRIVTSVQREIPGAEFSLPRITASMPAADGEDEAGGLIPFNLGEEMFFMEFSLCPASETA